MTSSLDELEQTLANTGQTSDPIAFSTLYAFSDLSRERLDRFRATWDSLPPHQRRRILARMAEFAEVSFRVSFGPIFRHCLDDSDGVVRTTAIRGLWEDDSPHLIGPYIRLLRTDPSPAVRAGAAKALGRFVLAGELEQLESSIQQRIVTELLTVLHLPDESSAVRCRAIESAGYACTNEVGEALELAYDDGDIDMQISAVVGMGRSCDQRWETVLLGELESSLAAMRYEAALACGELGLRQAVPALGRLILQSDREISMASIWALGQIGGDQAKQVLIAAYDDADDEERLALEDALAEHALSEGDLDFALYGLDDPEQGFSEYDLLAVDDMDDDSDDLELDDWDEYDWEDDEDSPAEDLTGRRTHLGP